MYFKQLAGIWQTPITHQDAYASKFIGIDDILMVAVTKTNLPEIAYLYSLSEKKTSLDGNDSRMDLQTNALLGTLLKFAA